MNKSCPVCDNDHWNERGEVEISTNERAYEYVCYNCGHREYDHYSFKDAYDEWWCRC